MSETQAREFRQACVDKMKQGGLSPDERMDLFAEFEKTNPDRKDVQDFYDVWSKDYDVDMMHAQYQNPLNVADEMKALFVDPKDIRILDVGAGTGEGGKKLAALGFTNIDATDGSPGMLALADKLKVYKNTYQEIFVEGEPISNRIPRGYDVITSSGSFYPYHLQGSHLRSIIDLVKTEGILVLSSCPHNDEKVGIRPAIKEAEADGIVAVVKETYIPRWYQQDDGTLWVLRRL